MDETLDNLIIDLDVKLRKLKEMFDDNLKKLSDCDKKEEDLKHAIEFKTLKAYQRCNIVTEYKKVRTERRIAKDTLDKLEMITTSLNKASRSVEDKDKIENKTNIFITTKLSNRKYNNRIYTEFDINKIIG
jgi:hypothetical protein